MQIDSGERTDGRNCVVKAFRQSKQEGDFKEEVFVSRDGHLSPAKKRQTQKIMAADLMSFREDQSPNRLSVLATTKRDVQVNVTDFSSRMLDQPIYELSLQVLGCSDEDLFEKVYERYQELEKKMVEPISQRQVEIFVEDVDEETKDLIEIQLRNDLVNALNTVRAFR